MKFGLLVACVATIGVAAIAAAGAEPPRELAACKMINTAAQLQAIGNSALSLTGTYCLGKDIDLSSVPNWVSIGGVSGGPYFQGQFYGNDHVIRNLKQTGSDNGAYGLFGAMIGGTIRDVHLVNVDINVTAMNGYAGALLGIALGQTNRVFIANVSSTGRVRCSGANCSVGGLIGVLSSNIVFTDAWSSAEVLGGSAAGGAIGVANNGPTTVQRVHATGNVTGNAVSVATGGLAGQVQGADTVVLQVYATGHVTGGDNAMVGGLIGYYNGTVLQGAYATGAVTGGEFAITGGLIGRQQDAYTDQVFAVGAVSGGTSVGGLFGQAMGTPTIANAYWDKITTGQMSSAAGMSKTTNQLRNALPANFLLGWGITKTLSYPFMNDPDNFSSTLATLVSSNKVFAFLPIRQGEVSEYTGSSTHSRNASLAAVYTMLARGVGVTDAVANLANVKIDKYFWHDATQTTTFSGPVTTHVTLGVMTSIAAATPLNAANVIGEINARRAVILRGTYTSGSSTATHYMLVTLVTKSGATVKTVVANDPWTGTQVEISPTTKKVVTPGFPLAGFKVDGYQAVTALN